MDETYRRILRKDTGRWNEWRNKHPTIIPVLRGKNLSGMDLHGADLRKADLREANLSDSDLSRTNLQGAALDGAILQNTRLVRANLQGSSLVDATLRGADLSHASLRNVPLTRADLRGAKMLRTDCHGGDLCECNLESVDAAGVMFGQAKLTYARLKGATLVAADLTGADLTCADLAGANLSRSSAVGAQLAQISAAGADLSQIDLTGAELHASDLRDAALRRAVATGCSAVAATLIGADLSGADFTNSDLRRVDFSNANLLKTKLARCDLTGGALCYARLVEADLNGANLSSCAVYGISAWGIKLEGTVQNDLIITPNTEPVITVDNLEVAQFVYLLLNNRRLRDVIDGVSSKVALILGRFTSERKQVLDGIRDELRQHNYLPVLFDFDRPVVRDTVETISILAHLSRFIIADITDARSLPQELERIVPSLPSVPVQPLIQNSDTEYGMFDHIKRYPWVLETQRYDGLGDLIDTLRHGLISTIEAKVQEARATLPTAPK